MYVNRLSKQLIRVGNVVSVSKLDAVKLPSENAKDNKEIINVAVPEVVKDKASIFKKPSVPSQSQKLSVGKPLDQIVTKSLSEDIDMKSATSVCSMDFNVVDLTKTPDSQSPPSKTPPAVVKHSSPAKSSIAVAKSDPSSNSQPIITVQVVHGNVVDLTGDDTKNHKVENKKPTSKSKKDSDKPPKKKKTTISEDTKLKIRDSIFANMLAKQKGVFGVMFLASRC